MGGGRVDRVQLRVGARAARGGAGGQDQPGRLQAGQQLRGGGLRQAGELADPGPGQRAVLQQEVERGPVVHGAQDARRARCAGGAGHDASLSQSRPGRVRATVRKVSYWRRKVGRAVRGASREVRPGRRLRPPATAPERRGRALPAGAAAERGRPGAARVAARPLAGGWTVGGALLPTAGRAASAERRRAAGAAAAASAAGSSDRWPRSRRRRAGCPPRRRPA